MANELAWFFHFMTIGAQPSRKHPTLTFFQLRAEVGKNICPLLCRRR